jgi:hypothetical protein
MRAIDKLLSLVNETDIASLVQSLGLEGKSVYYIDDLPGFNCKVALIIYHSADTPDVPLNQITTYAMFNTAFKFIAQNTVKSIMSGQIQFKPITSTQLKANYILVINQNGLIHNWGDLVSNKPGKLG